MIIYNYILYIDFPTQIFTKKHGFLRKLIIFGGWAIPIQGLVDLAACPVSKSTSGGLRRVPLRLGPLN